MLLQLTDYKPLTPGTYNFLIENVESDDSFMKLKINLSTVDGQKVTKNFTFIKADNTYNNGAISIFSWMARSAFNDPNLQGSIDPTSLTGRYIQATVSTSTFIGNDGQQKNGTNLGDFKPAPYGFSTPINQQQVVGQPVAQPQQTAYAPQQPQPQTQQANLNNLFGR